MAAQATARKRRFLGATTRTIGEVLDRHRGVGPGFDVLRLALAMAVVHQHAKWIATNVEAAGPGIGALSTVVNGMGDGLSLKRPLFIALVPMFFALSGFLVMGSAFRLRDTPRFLFFRALRIVPALSVEVCLVALVLGPLLTTLPVGAYLSDPLVLRYFGNIAGFVHMELPGLFASSPVPSLTNASLWTLPAEFYCYLVTAAAMLTGLLYDRRIFTALFALASVALLAASLAGGFAVSPAAIYSTPVITYYFFVGALFYAWRDRIPVAAWHIPVLAAICYAMLLSRYSVFVAPVFLVYLTVNIGMVAMPEVSRLMRGDCSYGLYLYHFPIAQALLTTVPAFRGQGWLLFGATLACALPVAALSWHLVEKPTLRLKVLVSRRERPIVGRFAGEAAPG
jgi:peptidoglycan/LPS O-acetylase OafA/YrhL